MLNRRVLTVLAMTAAAAGSLSFASAASAAPAMGTVRGAGEDGALKDRYIVVLKDGSTTTSDALAGKVGGSVSTRFNSTVKGFSGEMSSTAARRLAADPAVKYVEQDRVVSDRGDHARPARPWGLDRIDQRVLPLNRTYTYEAPAAASRAYIIDTGIRATHTEFGGRADVGYDAVDDGADADDCNGHGTHVAGTVGGTDLRRRQGRHAGRRSACWTAAAAAPTPSVIAGIDWVTSDTRSSRPWRT